MDLNEAYVPIGPLFFLLQLAWYVGATVLLVEQSAHVALQVADHGYIMENGRIVLDGDPEKLRANEDVKEFYLGGGGAEAKSYKNLKFYKRRKRWLS